MFLKKLLAKTYIQKTLKYISYYLILASALFTITTLISWLAEGYGTGLTFPEMLIGPIAAILSLPNPLSAYNLTSTATTATYALFVLLFIGWIWSVLARHDIFHPLHFGKEELDKKLKYRLRPRLRDVGIWIPHDPARNDPKAKLKDKLLYKTLKALPGIDENRAMVRRVTGMLVPVDAPQPGNRVYLGKYRHMHLFHSKLYHVYARPEHHVLIYGPSGTGKGASQMNPSMLFHNGDTSNSPDGYGKGWPGPLITSTVKNDHVDVSLEWRQSLSDQCYVYDPLQSYPEFKHMWVGWNPLSGINTFSEANAIAAALMDSEKQQQSSSSSNDDYFVAQALMVLAPLMLAAALRKEEFATVYQWSLVLEQEAESAVDPDTGVVSPESNMAAVLTTLEDYAATAGDDTPLRQLTQAFGKAPAEASGIWGSVRKSLQPYNDEKSVQSTSPKHMPFMFDPDKFYSTPYATLYIIAPEVASEAKRMRPVFAAFISWLIEQAQVKARAGGGKLPMNVLANLDEVKNVGAIPGLAHTLSLTRSAGFFVKHAWQDEAQIESAYGKDDSKTITSNSRTWAILPGISDPEHLENLSKLIGERTIKKRSRSKSGSGSDQGSVSTSKERVRTADTSVIKQLEDNQLLVVSDNLPPVLIEQNRYYADPIMYARAALGDARRKGEKTLPDPIEQPSEQQLYNLPVELTDQTPQTTTLDEPPDSEDIAALLAKAKKLYEESLEEYPDPDNSVDQDPYSPDPYTFSSEPDPYKNPFDEPATSPVNIDLPTTSLLDGFPNLEDLVDELSIDTFPEQTQADFYIDEQSGCHLIIENLPPAEGLHCSLTGDLFEIHTNNRLVFSTENFDMPSIWLTKLEQHSHVQLHQTDQPITGSLLPTPPNTHQAPIPVPLTLDRTTSISTPDLAKALIGFIPSLNTLTGPDLVLPHFMPTTSLDPQNSTLLALKALDLLPSATFNTYKDSHEIMHMDQSCPQARGKLKPAPDQPLESLLFTTCPTCSLTPSTPLKEVVQDPRFEELFKPYQNLLTALDTPHPDTALTFLAVNTTAGKLLANAVAVRDPALAKAHTATAIRLLEQTVSTTPPYNYQHLLIRLAANNQQVTQPVIDYLSAQYGSEKAAQIVDYASYKTNIVPQVEPTVYLKVRQWLTQNIQIPTGPLTWVAIPGRLGPTDDLLAEICLIYGYLPYPGTSLSVSAIPRSLADDLQLYILGDVLEDQTYSSVSSLLLSLDNPNQVSLRKALS